VSDAWLTLALVAIWLALWLAIRARVWRVAWLVCGAHAVLVVIALRGMFGDAWAWFALDVAALWLVMKPRKMGGDADV
jgi:hypothetical protein